MQSSYLLYIQVNTTMLQELKLRFTHHFVALCCLAFCCYLSFFELCVLTITPFDNLCFLDLTEAFSVTIKLVLFFTTVFIAPPVCFHGWGFVSPALTQKHPTQVFFASPLWLLVSLISSHVLTHSLSVWFLGYSRLSEGLVLQYLPLMSAFLWFKFKCFLCVAACLAGLHAYGRRLLRRWFYSAAVLLGAFLAAGVPQFIFSFCIILLCELWFFSSYVIQRLRQSSRLQY